MNTTDEEQIYSIALTLLPGVGHITARQLVTAMGSATDVFRLRNELPDRLPDISRRVVQLPDISQSMKRAEQEYEFACKNGIRCLTYYDEAYPSRLRECEDAPIVLFFKGNADLNAVRTVSMVGTRHATSYGAALCASFLNELKSRCPDVLVVSGLAYGIDVLAHREALANGLPTVGVLAHGLDRIYPPVHRKTAVDMLEQGGLITEFPSGTNPDRYNFVGRNRIVAGMCDATIVVESAEKGGSLITADLAGGYNRECFAFPGRVTDEFSKGCNLLIRENKAAVLLSADDLIRAMGWDVPHARSKRAEVQRTLFPDLSEEEQRLVDILGQPGDHQLNTLVVESDMPVNRVSALLFSLEMKKVVRVQAGGMYQLL